MLLFTDISFWIIFLAFLAIYALVRHYMRWGMMFYVVSFSMAFYWLANGWLLLLLPAVALVAWGVGRVLVGQPRFGGLLLSLSIVACLLPLLYFKYAGFLLSSYNALTSSHFSVDDVFLPIGISFFTFQAISYLVDVYRGKFTLQVSLLEFLFYLSFFPLLLAGPITRAGVLLPQLRRQGAVSVRILYVGVWLMMIGLIKKCVIADYIAQYNDWIFADPEMYSGFECMMGIWGYTVQIYCDFSGYSDMSIGLAAMMGFSLPDNFAFPYRAHDLSQFWRRWHISLSTWFRDYLYIPLGGNRCSRVRTYLNNIITMLVAGLWHGASWMFVFWGGIHGVGLVLQKAFQSLLPRAARPSRWRAACGVCLTIVYVAVAWVFFRSNSVDSALLLLRHSVVDFDLAYLIPFISARPWWCILVVVPLALQAISSRTYLRLQTRFVCAPWVVKAIMLLLVLQLVLQFKVSNVQPFIYYQF